MPVEILEPLRLWLSDPSVRAAVEVLRARDSDKRISLDPVADCLNQNDYLEAWLAAQEIYVAWHKQLAAIWNEVWTGNPLWGGAMLTPLNSAEMAALGWELPTLHRAWDDEWFGSAFRTSKGDLVGLYIYADSERVYLNYASQTFDDLPEGWEEDDGDLESEKIAYWKEDEIDVSSLVPAATSLLSFLKVR